MVGRPIEDSPRDAHVIVRVLAEERSRWQRAAEASDMTLSAWLRDLANRAEKRIAKRTKGKR